MNRTSKIFITCCAFIVPALTAFSQPSSERVDYLALKHDQNASGETVFSTKYCTADDVNIEDVRTFFEKSEIRYYSAYNYHYTTTPCAYAGKIMFHGLLWDYSIFRSGYGNLRNAKVSGFPLGFTCFNCGVLTDEPDADIRHYEETLDE